MRLSLRNQRTVTIRAPDATADESLRKYLPGGWTLDVIVQPTGYSDSRNQLKAHLWGEMPEKALVMYVGRGLELMPGQGVCVEASADAPCDYRITGVEDWPGHKRAYLAFIPENRRWPHQT